MNIILNDDLLEKFNEIFFDKEAKLEIGINAFTIDNNYGTSLKTNVDKDRTCFRQNNDRISNILPRQATSYNCRMLLKI